jgi:hypothetical protein
MKTITKLALAAALILGLGHVSTAKADVVDTDMLRPGQTMTYTVRLFEGQYLNYGVEADEDACDVDLRVLAPGGFCIASDTLDDAVPVVRFTAPVTGIYQIKVEMISRVYGVPCFFNLLRL